MLALYSKYQDISGKIYHELTTSGVAHYDAADATPLYIILAGKYLRFSGDRDFIRQEWPHILKAIKYCYSTDTDKDGLIENTLVGHGWEEGGALFGTHTTFYLASCWAEALKQAIYLAKSLNMINDVYWFTPDKNRVLKIMNTDFWNPATNYFFHGKYKDGTFHPEPDVMAAVPLLFGQVSDSLKFTQVLQRLASNEFSTDWGVRILGDNSAFFKPGSYHQGSVWPLFTGWTSLAEFANGRGTQGYSHLMNNLLTYRKWSLGFVPEVLHGNEYKPFGVCAHQCWSETMVVEPALEGMLGIQPDAMANHLTLSPHFPLDWDSVTVKNIRMNDQFFRLEMRQETDKSVWILKRSGNMDRKIDVSLNLAFPAGTSIQKVLVDRKETTFNMLNAMLVFKLTPAAETRIEIYRKGGICALPEQQEIQPGDFSSGYRIISEEFNGNIYTLKLNGKVGSEADFRIYSPGSLFEAPASCSLINSSGNISVFHYRFPDADSKYVTNSLVFTFK